MIRLFTPLILVVAALGLFWLYTNPTYQTIKQLQIENTQYDDALTKAQQLRQKRDELLAKRNSFSQTDLDKLSHILPDNLDNIRLIIDVNNIATRHNLSLANVDLGTSKQTEAAPSEGVQNPVGSATIGFSVNTDNYDDFLAFLQDVEHNERIIDISKVEFTVSNSALTTYAISAKSYWLH